MEIVLIRHGESEANVLQKDNGVFFCGRFDCALTDKGRMQAESLKDSEYVKNAEAVYSSPLRRAVETASLLWDNDIIIEPAVTERSMGDFDGKWKSELEATDKYRMYFVDEKYGNFRSSFTVSAPNGESYGDVVRRVKPFLYGLKEKHCGKVVIVSHYVAIRCMLKVIQHISDVEVLNVKIKQCDPIVLDF